MIVVNDYDQLIIHAANEFTKQHLAKHFEKSKTAISCFARKKRTKYKKRLWYEMLYFLYGHSLTLFLFHWYLELNVFDDVR